MDVRDSEKRESGKRTKEKIRELTTVSVERVWASQFSRYSLRKIGLSLQHEMVNVHRPFSLFQNIKCFQLWFLAVIVEKHYLVSNCAKNSSNFWIDSE